MKAKPRTREYASFDELATENEEGVDFRVEMLDRSSGVVVVAPHGGYIEFETAELALEIAGDDFSAYTFRALKRHARPHPLHVTSHNFDEPRCLQLVGRSEVVITIHGRADSGDKGRIYFGGLDERLMEVVARALKENGFSAKLEGHPFPAQEPTNICNRGKACAGVQLELPKSLRTKMRANRDKRRAFVAAVRAALKKAALPKKREPDGAE